MSKQTFDPITRSIRTIETEARLAIASAETAIASARRKRRPTVAGLKEAFDKVGTCLQNTNQLYDNVVAHSHLVADNIASRSQRNVVKVRNNLQEVANQKLQLTGVGSGLPEGVYNPQNAFDTIEAALKKSGLLDGEPKYSSFTIDTNEIGFIATYNLEEYQVAIVVSVGSGIKTLGSGSDVIVVSVWEARIR